MVAWTGFSLPSEGQGLFRVLLTDIYGRKCAGTGERQGPEGLGRRVSWLRKLGRGLKNAGKGIGKGAVFVSPLAVPLAASAMSPVLGQIAEQLLDATEAAVPEPGRGAERLALLRLGGHPQTGHTWSLQNRP